MENLAPPEDHEYAPAVQSENVQQRMDHLRGSVELLQIVEPDLLKNLEEARRDCFPVVLHVEGYEHTGELILAILRCAHAFGVTLTVLPYPASRIRNAMEQNVIKHNMTKHDLLATIAQDNK